MRGFPSPSLRRICFAGALALSAALPGAGLTAPPSGGGGETPERLVHEAASPPAPVSPSARRQLLEAYRKLTLSFVPNEGQTDARVRFSAQAGGASFWFTATDAVFAFAGEPTGHILRLGFVGANPHVEIDGARPAPGRVNYVLGSDPATWRTGLPTYGEVVYRDLWPGIDLAFRGEQGKLKYEFRLAPGARVGDIRLVYRGADRLALGPAGGLRVHTPLGVLCDSRPVSYQVAGGRRVPVESRYVLNRVRSGYGFALGAYDPRHPLVVDPGLLYSTFMGGSSSDQGRGIAIDAAGSAYVTGLTGSSNFPTTVGAFDTTFNGNGDAFVTKLDVSGSGLAYSTYLGGSTFDGGLGIAVDAAGSAYVTGQTDSFDFPTTVGAFDTTFNGTTDAFVAKLDATGSTLAYSTYLGGTVFDPGSEIAVDAAGSAYVTGQTDSSNFPTTAGAFDTTFSGNNDAFVTKLNPTGSALAYSTYLGGSSTDQGQGIGVDAAGSAYVTGRTFSSDFPTTAGAFDTTFNGSDDVFVTKLNPTGSALGSSTYLGGSSSDQGRGIAVDAAGSAYVTGRTRSSSFPTTAGAFDTTFNGSDDAFVTKLHPSGSALASSTYVGGTSSDGGFGIAVDAAGSAYVTGSTFSSDFPTTAGAFDTTFNGIDDAFVTKLDATGSALAYSTYLGGSVLDEGLGIVVDAAGTAYATGFTSSVDFPTTVGAFDTTFNGSIDAFVTKLDTTGVGAPATLVLSPAAATNPVGTSHTVTATVRDAAGNPVPNVHVHFSVTGSVITSGSCTTGATGQCSFTYSGPALPGADTITAFADSDSDGTQGIGEPSGAATKTWVLPASTPGCEVTIADAGKITAANGDTATFSGHAKVSSSGQDVSGQQQYKDHGPAQPLTVQSINVLAVVCSPDRTEATIFGQATIDGSGSFDYRIRVKDLGEPGKGLDVYGILVSNGYASGDQTLEAGNVQITVQE